jgi:hypothetical protein
LFSDIGVGTASPVYTIRSICSIVFNPSFICPAINLIRPFMGHLSRTTVTVTIVACCGMAGMEGRSAMKIRDLFVPRWDHSDPMVRKKAVEKMNNVDLIRQIAERDEHPMVRDTATALLNRLTGEKVEVSEQD